MYRVSATARHKTVTSPVPLWMSQVLSLLRRNTQLLMAAVKESWAELHSRKHVKVPHVQHNVKTGCAQFGCTVCCWEVQHTEGIMQHTAGMCSRAYATWKCIQNPKKSLFYRNLPRQINNLLPQLCDLSLSLSKLLFLHSLLPCAPVQCQLGCLHLNLLLAD